MKAIVTILGVIFLIAAAMYFLVPADSLPTFFPGHETGLMRIRAKHGMLTGRYRRGLAWRQLVSWAKVMCAGPSARNPAPKRAGFRSFQRYPELPIACWPMSVFSR